MTLSMIAGPGRAGRSRAPWWTALLVLLGLGACTPTPPAPRETEPTGPSLYLELASLTGDTISEALIRLSSGQREQADARGTLLLEKLPVGPQLLGIDARDYYPTVLTFDMAEGVRAGARLRLLPLGLPLATFDASKGTTESRDGVTLTVPEGALRDARGNPIEGEVEAFLTSLNLEGGELVAAPGMLEGIPMHGGQPVGLESLGMVALVFKKDGQLIPFARGVRIRGSVPGSIRVGAQDVPGGVQALRASGTLTASALPQVPVWRLDPEDSGRWVPTGELGRLVEGSIPGSLEWEVTVDNPSRMLNVALPFWWRSPSASPGNPLQAPTPAWVETSCLVVRVEDEQGQPVAGRMVVAEGVDYTSVSRALTDGDGLARLEVMRNRSVRVEAGGQPTTVPTGTVAGNCHGEGAEPTPVTLSVSVRTCTPGAARDCAYSGPKGTLDQGSCRAARQSCDAQGTGWSTCLGEVLPQQERCANTLDDDCDGAVNETCGPLCQEGATQPCYTGPEGTENVGPCRGGTRTCVAGAWSECTGQVLPAESEDYSQPEDENCDGVVGLCWPGEPKSCPYTGPPGTQGKGICHAGTKTCDGIGTSWSECTGEVTPLPQEDCTLPGDDDCDGVENEVSVCLCVPDTIESCPYGGPAGTQGVGVCHAGTKTCAASGTAWSTCTVEVTPQPESCATSADDDCDGQRNESPPCGWVVSTMPEARKQHTTVVLSDGRVLVSGGIGSGNSALKSAALYDPATRTWSALADMKSTRSDHAAVVLSGDKVLVSGGYGLNEGESSPARLATAEVYDPVANTWTYVGSMASVRDYHALTRLSTGRVLVSGGFGASDRIALAEVYDPVTETWTSVGAMGSARAGHTATRLSGDKVLVSGGDTAGTSVPLATAEVYDPDDKTWTPVGAMSSARARHTATLLNGDKVLVSGGFNGSDTLATAELYDPDDKTWTAVGDMGSRRKAHTAVRLSTGAALVLGGDDMGSPLATAELYDPVANTWTPLTPMAAARTEHTTVSLNGGEVLVTGGRGASAPLATVEVYNPTPTTQSGAWMSVNSMVARRHKHRATLLSDGKVLVTGGKSGGTTLQSAEVYDPSTGNWSSAGAMSAPREGHSATLLASGKVLVAGGFNGTTALSTAELYDPLDNTWTTLPSNLVTPRQVHTATLLPDGTVLLAGGINGPVLGTNILNKAEVYDPADDTFTPTNDLVVARYWHTATLLNDGAVLVAGGHLATDSTQQAEVYSAGTWSSVGSLGLSRDFHTATLLNTGEVLVTGGYGDTLFRQSAELYDQDGRTWTNTGALTTGRREHTATLLDDGKVLVLGGKDGDGSTSDDFLSSAELYDPQPGTWSSANFLVAPLAQHTATRLKDGKVLVTGGENHTGSLNTVLLYSP